MSVLLQSMKQLSIFLSIFLFFSCNGKVEKLKPYYSSVSESIYASGTLKSLNQYQAFATVNGIITDVFVKEGDSVKMGTPILSISNETQKLNKENAELAAKFSDFNANSDKLREAKLQIELAKSKMKNDSNFFFRQKKLWAQEVGTKMDLEQKELAYLNSKTALFSSILKYEDLNRQLNFASSQSKKTFLISGKQLADFTLKSEVDGVVYDLLKSKGESVGLQAPLAVIGDASHFILEMQVDEYDIFKISLGLKVLITMDSYKGKVFEAIVSRISPIMNERNKTFVVEAQFIKQPEKLFPNISFEANIILKTKNKALLIPRSYLLNDSFVIKANGDKLKVQTGLKDYQKVEILSGISPNEDLIKPTP